MKSQLIKFVHTKPAIWDQKYLKYYHRDVKAKLWIEIADSKNASGKIK